MTARSVLLSVLLGTHPPSLAVRTLVRTAELFGISEGTARVALSRLSADGEVVGNDGFYQLSERLAERQRAQDSAVRPPTRPWRGTWEMAVAGPAVGTAVERAALGADLARLRLAELRPGIWIRPANLVREWPEAVREKAMRFEGRAALDRPGAAALVGALWDLTGWAAAAEALLGTLSAQGGAADRFVTAAAMVRHLRDDPMLPNSLLPPRWPGARLRTAYAAYRHELGELMARERERAD